MLFVSFLVLAATVNASCTADERAVWFNNAAFSSAYATCATNAWGNGRKTVDCLSPKYPELLGECVACFGQTAECGKKRCMRACMRGFDLDCNNCIEQKCSFQLLACTEALSFEELPLAPGESPVEQPQADLDVVSMDMESGMMPATTTPPVTTSSVTRAATTPAVTTSPVTTAATTTAAVNSSVATTSPQATSAVTTAAVAMSAETTPAVTTPCCITQTGCHTCIV